MTLRQSLKTQKLLLKAFEKATKARKAKSKK